MRRVNIHEAKANLWRLIEEAARGQPFVTAKAGKPVFSKAKSWCRRTSTRSCKTRSPPCSRAKIESPAPRYAPSALAIGGGATTRGSVRAGRRREQHAFSVASLWEVVLK